MKHKKELVKESVFGARGGFQEVPREFLSELCPIHIEIEQRLSRSPSYEVDLQRREDRGATPCAYDVVPKMRTGHLASGGNYRGARSELQSGRRIL